MKKLLTDEELLGGAPALLSDEELLAIPQTTAAAPDPAPARAADADPRTAWETTKDIAASALGGLVNVAKLPAMAADRAIAGQWIGPGVEALTEFGESVDAQKTEFLRGRQAQSRTRATEFGQRAQEWAGGEGALGTVAREVGEFGAGVVETLRDPTLLVSEVAQQGPMVAASRLGGLVAGKAAQGAAAAAPRIASTAAGRAAVTAAPVAGAVATGAGLQGADIGADTQQRLLALPDEVWSAFGPYRELAAQVGPDEAKRVIAGDKAGAAALQAALASLLSSALPGGAALERAVVGRALTGKAGALAAAKAVGSAVAGEARQEGIEEGYGALASNYAVHEVDPSQDLAAGVGEAAGRGAALGGLMGGGATAASIGIDAARSWAASRTAPPGRGPGTAYPGASSAPPAQTAPAGQAAPPVARPVSDPATRLVELEIAAAQRALTAEEATEVDRLTAALDEPQGAPAYSSADPTGDLQGQDDDARAALFTPRPLTSLERLNEIDAALAAGDTDVDAATLQAERERITASFPPSVRGASTSFSTESGAQIQGAYALLEADDLVTSHTESLRPNPTYPSELQPRERDRAASEAQISGIVAKLDPARLGISADAATGAPIIGADGLVESGNARTIALKRVYQARGAKAQAYRDYLKANAAQFGLAPEVIDAMHKPVLVRVRVTPVDRAEFARQANTSTVAAMSASEQAKSDAARVDSMEDLQPDDNGDFSGPASRPFIRRFMSRLPINEQAGMVEADGTLSQAGYARVRNAVLAKAYGDSPVLRRMVESLDDNSRNVTKALMIAAPRVAAMREAIGQGRRFDADVTPDLMAAVQELSSLREQGTSVADALAQQGIEGDPYSPETREILGFLADNARRPRRMADFIVGFMDALDAAGDPAQGSLLGDTQPPSKMDLMGAARRAADGGVAEDPQRGDAGTNAAPGVAPGVEPAAAAGADGAPAGDGAAPGPDSRLSGGEQAGSGQAEVAAPPARNLWEFARQQGYTPAQVNADAALRDRLRGQWRAPAKATLPTTATLADQPLLTDAQVLESGAALRQVDAGTADAIDAKARPAAMDLGDDITTGPVLSRREAGAGGAMSTADVRLIAARIRLKFPGLPPVHVLDKPDDLSRDGTQGRLRQAIEHRGAMGDAEGALHEGQIYLFAGHLVDVARVQHVLVEHEVGHLGLRGLLGDKLPQTLRALFNGNAELRRAATAMMRTRPDLSQIEAVEEVIVDMPSDRLARLTGWRKLVAAVRDILAARGFNRLAGRLSRWIDAGLDAQTKADLFVADLVRAARRQAMEPTPARSQSRTLVPATEPALSRAREPGQAADGDPAPAEPDPDSPNPWHRLKARVLALTSPEALDKLIYEFQDKLIDLKRLREHVAALGGTVTDLNDAYLGEELFHARLAKRTHDFLDTEVRPLLAEVRSRGLTVPLLERYLHARHAPEANRVLAERNPSRAMVDEARAQAAAQVRELQVQRQRAVAQGSSVRAIDEALAQAQAELARQNRVQAFAGTEDERRALSGISDAQAAEFMASLTPRQREGLQAVAERVDAMQERTLQALQEYGLMTREALDAWRATYEHYVPLHRDEAKAEGDRHPIGQGFSVKGDASRRRTGSTAEVTNILAHVVMQREAALTRGEKNLVVKRLYLMAAQNPDGEFWAVDKAPTMQVIDPDTGTVRATVDPTYRHRPNVLMLRIAGRDHAIVFNERNPQAMRLAESLKNLDSGDLHVVLGVVAKGTRWFASVNTQYNPIFGIVNFVRDVQAGLLNLSTTPLRGDERAVMAQVPAALRAIYRQRRGKAPTDAAMADLWQDFQDAGGPTGYRDVFVKVEDRAKALTRELDALDRGQVSQAAHAIVDWLSDYNEAMENAVRLATYKIAQERGIARERAASLAKNITVNFNRKGRQTREIGALYAFFNAALQGTARMVETLRGPLGRRIMAGGVSLGAINALVGVAMMGGDGDEPNHWDQIPEFIRERSLIIPLSREDYLTIPMPLGFHVFPNIGRLAVEFALGESDKSTAAKIGDLLMIVADAFNPLGGAQNITQMAAPTVLDPVVALMENRDWTGRPIYRENPTSTNPQPGHAMARDSASTVSRALAQAINRVTGGTEYRPGAWSPTPDQIDFVFGQLTGGLGREVIKVNQTAAAPFTGDDLPPYKIPLVGRFYGNTRGEAGQAGRFYENVRAVNLIESELRGRMRNGQDYEQWRDSEPLVKLIGRGAAVERFIARARQERRILTERAEPGYQERVREIDRRIADAMSTFNTEVDRARREASAGAVVE